MDRLFVYGSLQPGGPNERVLARVEGEWEAASVTGFLREEGWGADLGYPGLVLDEAGPEVRGALFASPDLDGMWRELDELEGDEYERTLTTVRRADGTMASAYVYVLRGRVREP